MFHDNIASISISDTARLKAKKGKVDRVHTSRHAIHQMMLISVQACTSCRAFFRRAVTNDCHMKYYYCHKEKACDVKFKNRKVDKWIDREI